MASIFHLVQTGKKPEDHISIVTVRCSVTGSYDIFFQALDPVASDVRIIYKFYDPNTGTYSTFDVVMQTGERSTYVSGATTSSEMRWKYATIQSVIPTSDDTYIYTYSTELVDVMFPIDVTSTFKIYGAIGPAMTSDEAIDVPLDNIIDFDGNPQSGGRTIYVTLPGKYNPSMGNCAVSGEVNCEFEARNNTTNSMTMISLELLMSNSQSDTGTDRGTVIGSWVENYPVGGLYITLNVSDSIVSQDLSVLGSEGDVYFWFVAKVVYTGYDTPNVTCNYSDVSLTVRSQW